MTAFIAKAEMRLRAPVRAVFDAFVDPEVLCSFWLDHSSGLLAENAVVEWHFMVPGARETVTVTEFVTDRCIAFEWSEGVHVTFRFDAQSDGATHIGVTASGFETVEQAVGATEGFSIVLCDLKTLLESGRSANLVRDKAALIVAAQAEST